VDTTQPWDHSMTWLVRKNLQSPVPFPLKAIPLSWQPVTSIHATIDSGKTLPNPNAKDLPPTPEEINLIGNLLNEFGGTIPEGVLQYLVRWLGASKRTAAVIRCLYQNGYLSLPSSVYNSAVLERDYRAALNAVVNHLDPNDLEGAWKDANPSEVDPTTIKDPRYVSGAEHTKEVKGALSSINSLIISLDKKMDHLNRFISQASDPNAPNILDMITQKAFLRKLKDVFTKLQQFVQSKIQKGYSSPDTWPDQGQVPFIEDLLQVSPCKVPGAQYYK
jgi:hypothetical protein